ncbi:MAG: hypothetical protein ACC651_15815 [Candidatus Scalindua sp.]
MKQLTQTLAVIVLALLLFSGKSFAQSSERPMLVTSLNIVNLADVGAVNKLVDSLITPVLKELVDEGMLFSFGQFNHSWGDEWNVNFWYTVKDMTAFDKFWKEYVSRMMTRHPGAFGTIVKYFNAHKDNIYTIRQQYPEPLQD